MHKCLLGTHSNEDNWGRVSVQFDSSSKYWAQYSDHLALFIYCNISSCHLVKHVQPYVNLWMDASGAPPTPWIFLNGPSPPMGIPLRGNFPPSTFALHIVYIFKKAWVLWQNEYFHTLMVNIWNIYACATRDYSFIHTIGKYLDVLSIRSLR